MNGDIWACTPWFVGIKIEISVVPESEESENSGVYFDLLTVRLGCLISL